MSIAEPPAGLSVWESELYSHLARHVEGEAAMMHAYEKLAIESDVPHVAFLINLIAQDEARHHKLYEEWMETLRAFAELRDDAAGVPHLRREANAAEIMSRAEQLLAFEENDARELKELARDLKEVRETTLWGILVEVMRLDTEKHIKMLSFLRDHAARTLKAEAKAKA